MSYIDDTKLQYFGEKLVTNISTRVSGQIPAATTSTNGLMSASDKVKMNSLTSGYETIATPTNTCIHNAVYRNKNLTDEYTLAEIIAMIADGTFSDIYVGDELTVGNYTYIVAGLDYYLNKNGNASINQHHIAIIPKSDIGSSTSTMNSSNTTAGGYYNSYMATVTIPALEEEIAPDFTISNTEHLLSHYVLLNSGSNGAWATTWKEVKMCLMNELQVFGTTTQTVGTADIGVDDRILPVFKLNTNVRKITGGKSQYNWWWLRSVYSAYPASYFASVDSGGSLDGNDASGAGGVQPLLIIG